LGVNCCEKQLSFVVIRYSIVASTIPGNDSHSSAISMQGVDLTRSAFSEGLPVQNQRSVVSANGTKTDILCQTFTDRHFVLVTQFGKMGTLVRIACVNCAHPHTHE
jgi:hypothetical protein